MISGALANSYDYRLVALSVFIAVLASYAALDLAGRLTSARGAMRHVWLTGGAIAMGTGIWSMHYIGMLAFRLPIPVEYDWATVLVSLVAAILASGVALVVVSRTHMRLAHALVGSLFMGGGIATMHYTGMAAMRLDAICEYSPRLVLLSVVLAVAISLVALWLAFRFRDETHAWSWMKVVSAVVMGAAIPIMHYTGMAAATFFPSSAGHGEHLRAISAATLSVTGVTTVTVMILGLAIVTAFADRRFALQALELESSRRHRQIIEAALDAFVGMDTNGLITDWNAQAEATFGWTRAEAIGRFLADTIIPPRSRDAHTRGLWQFLAPGEAQVLNTRIDTTAIHRDGHEFPIELTVCPVQWGDKRLFAAFVRDVTERKQAQEILAAKMEELARSNAELEQFANVASHDLQEPLRMVASYTQLLARRYKGRLDADADEFIGFAVDGATRMQKLIHDLLAYSRVTTHGQSFKEVEARVSCDEALRDLAHAIADAGACVTVGPLPRVRADSTQLTHLFQNLVGNALKYRNQRKPEIRVTAQAEGALAIFSVQDNGIGIEPQYCERIFQMFQRLHTVREYSGTGIGLTLCRKIVERHGGRIWVESTAGEGSTFLFTLILAERREA